MPRRATDSEPLDRQGRRLDQLNALNYRTLLRPRGARSAMTDPQLTFWMPITLQLRPFGRTIGRNMKQAGAGIMWLYRVALLVLPAVTEAQLLFTTNDGAITITGYSGNPTDLNIPSATNGYPVTSIAANALSGSSTLTNLIIPGSVTNIGNRAFSYSYSLKNVSLTNGLISIGDGAFSFCYGLASVTIPSGVTDIGEQAFFSSPLQNVTIPDTVRTIGAAGFCSTWLTNIVLPHGLTNIGNSLLLACNFLQHVTIPDTVTSIGDSAFESCYALEEPTLPVALISIGVDAFGACFTFTNLFIPANVSEIGVHAFWQCPQLRNITVAPSNSTFSSLDGVVFDKNQTTLLFFPNGRHGNYAIPNGVTTIATSAFDLGSEIHLPGPDKVTIPASVTNIGDEAFSNCRNLAGLYFLGDAPTNVGSYVFYNDDQAVAWYLPGASGWSSTFAEIPAAPWNPKVQTGEASFGVKSNQFGFSVAGSTNLFLVIEAATNLSFPTWQPVQTNTLTNGSVYFSDPGWTNFGSRFYRLRAP